MTLDQFLAVAHADLAAFADATRAQQAAKAEGFIEPEHVDREHDDWWREVMAYLDGRRGLGGISRIEHLIECVNKLRDHRRAEMKYVGGWQPIETAPEATYVLVLVPNYGYNIATMTRDPKFQGKNSAWWFIRGEIKRCYPTHWMPLPAPPDPAPAGESK